MEILPRLTNFLKINSTNERAKNQLEAAETTFQKAIAVILALHAFLHESGKGKSSIASSIKYMLFLANNVQSYVAEIEKRRDEIAIRGETFQPVVILFGDDYDKVMDKKFLVYCDGVVYKFVNFFKAMEILFNIYIVFDLKWPVQNKSVFSTILNLIYGSIDPRDKQISLKGKLLWNALNAK